MGLIERLRNSRIAKIILGIFLLIIIFDKLIILGIISIYYLIQKVILGNEVSNPLEIIKKYTNKNIKEEYNNLNINNVINENISNKLSNIFKEDKYNLGEYANNKVLKSNNFLPECCMYYSDYSTDKGCACITPEQQNYLQRRGLNRNKDSFIHEYDLKNLFFSPTNSLKGNKDDIFVKHNIYINKGPEELSDSNINEVYSLLNMQER